MPKKTGRPRLYANARDRQRACRARRKAEAAHQLDAVAPVVAVVDHADPIGVLATWAAETLIVPPGHPRSGAVFCCSRIGLGAFNTRPLSRPKARVGSAGFFLYGRLIPRQRRA